MGKNKDSRLTKSYISVILVISGWSAELPANVSKAVFINCTGATQRHRYQTAAGKKITQLNILNGV